LCFVSAFCVSFKFVNHGSHLGNTAQALDQWHHPVASSEALDVPHWAMRLAVYRRICMAIKIASNLPTFVVVVDLLLPTPIAK
jgi:hypothetical protein